MFGTYELFWLSGDFSQSDQQGTAEWDPTNNTWDVSSCRLQRDNVFISQYDRNCTGTVWRGAAAISGNAVTEYSITYNGVARYYCDKCDAGKTPQFSTRSNAFELGCATYEYYDTEYLACKCENVDDGYYSTGCNITYPLDTPEIPNGCRLQQTYCDQTGCFVLGTDICE